MAGQQECSLQSSPFSGLLQPFPSLVVLALHRKLVITRAIFGSESLYTLGSNVLCLCMFCRKQFGKKKKKHIPANKGQMSPFRNCGGCGAISLVTFVLVGSMAKRKASTSNMFSDARIWVVFFQHWSSFAGGRVNSCPQRQRETWDDRAAPLFTSQVLHGCKFNLEMGVGKQKGAKVHGNLKDSCLFVVHENRLVLKLL